MLDDGEEEPISLYFRPTPDGLKISILLEELGVPYDVKDADVGKREHFAAQFHAASADLGFPAIVDPEGPDGHPLVMFESGAILHYLARKFGGFYPSNERARADVDQWLFWQVSRLGPIATQCNHFRHHAREKDCYAIDYYTNEVGRLFGAMDVRLRDSAYLAGSYSIADIASFPWVRSWKTLAQDISRFPNVERWLREIGGRPAVARGLSVTKKETTDP
ncbi:MAG: glutathione S-transferase N-terminal domain-containing protein [Proteobacteria bacterium]|nr:glutathione S-transferase N-terminal domain-containing protein [Pseudomonadota bacterium]